MLRLNFETASVPESSALTNAERQQKYRTENHSTYMEVRTRYRRTKSRWETNASYLSHPFIAWDGEGITREDGSHDYVMLAVKGAGISKDIINPHGIGTAQAFDFLLDVAQEAPEKAIHVIYGGSYDFNMIMRDIPRETMDRVYHKRYATWQDYRIGWRNGKSLYVCRIDDAKKKVGQGVTIYDVVSFFQCTFVKACDDYLGDDFTNRDMIVANKAVRGAFRQENIADVRRYNDAELDNLLALMDELRKRLNACNLRPRRWDGPGAVAAALLQRERVKECKGDVPAGPARAARFAYAGGRFEVIKFGHVPERVFEYDVNSAYPAALRNVPDLSDAKWRKVTGDPGFMPFALYHATFKGNRADIPGALFRRDPNGTICYPLTVTGWYWTPEIETAREYCARGYGTLEISEAWVCYPASDRRPFDFIDGLYNKRKALKRAGDGAHVGIKLALNSLYGKLAQQVGASMTRAGEWRIPPFHQLEWAGYVTSWCRSRVLGACLDNLDDVIAFETDAVFTRAPLPVTIGDGLGEWEATEFDSLTYVQSGLYFGESNGKAITKTRGVDRGTLTRDIVLAGLREPSARDRYAVASLTRFVGIGVALAQNWDRWRRWERVEKHMILEPTGKRIHLGCDCMHVEYDANGKVCNTGLALGVWHKTACPLLNIAHSAQFPIVWINPDPRMSELEEMRNEPDDWE